MGLLLRHSHNSSRDNSNQLKTSRKRPKSAPYLRLRNSKRTSKCQNILFYSTRKTQKLDRIGAPGGNFEIFHPFCRKSKKLRDPLIFFKTVSQCRRNWKGDPVGFFNIYSVAKLLKKHRRGDPLGGVFFSNKSLNAEKTERGTLQSRPVLYVTREKGKTF